MSHDIFYAVIIEQCYYFQTNDALLAKLSRQIIKGKRN